MTDKQQAIRQTAQFVADLTSRTDPDVRVAASALVLSSLVVAGVKPEKRMEVFDLMVKEMRHHIAQANLKEKKAQQ